MNILQEDRFLLFCEKPVGIPSQPAPGVPEDMTSLLGQYRAAKGEPAQVFAVHRLDRGVGGLMVYAKDAKTAGKLSALIQQRQFTKEYLAVLHGIPPEEQGTLRDLLFRDAAKNKTYVVQRERRGVREAVLEYRLLGTAGSGDGVLSLVRVHLLTGRTYQVRVQFASRGLPLLGNGKYGARDSVPEIALWSTRIAFEHPVTGKPLDCTLPAPCAFPWNEFTSNAGLGGTDYGV